MCGVVVTVEDRALAVRGDPSHPLSAGYLCPKGRALAAFTTAPERLRDPQVGRPDERVAGRGTWCSTTWPSASGGWWTRAGPTPSAPTSASPPAVDSAGRWAADAFLASLGSRSRYTSTSNEHVEAHRG